MCVRLLATGTCGDVQPYVALGLGLKRAGFEVSFAATANSRPFVESYGVSPSVLPKARNWGGHVHLTGYWFLPDDHYEPPEDQNHFLNAGDPPVFVSFGSMASKGVRATAATVLEAVREAGYAPFWHPAGAVSPHPRYRQPIFGSFENTVEVTVVVTVSSHSRRSSEP